MHVVTKPDSSFRRVDFRLTLMISSLFGRHDDTALTELVKLNLLGILVRYLDDYSTKNSQEHQQEEAADDGGKERTNNDGEPIIKRN